MELWKHSRWPFRHGSEGAGGTCGRTPATDPMEYRQLPPGQLNSSSASSLTGSACRKFIRTPLTASGKTLPRRFISRPAGLTCLFRAPLTTTMGATKQCTPRPTTVKVSPLLPACRSCSNGRSCLAHGHTGPERPAAAMYSSSCWTGRCHLRCATRTGRICPGTTAPIAGMKCSPSTATSRGSIRILPTRSAAILIHSRSTRPSVICRGHWICIPARHFGQHGSMMANDAAYFDRTSITWASCVAGSCS